MRHKVAKNGNFKFDKNGYLNTVKSLMLSEKVYVTLTRAKKIKPFSERIITLGKENSLHSRKLLLSKLGGDEKVVNKVIEIANSTSLKERKGGYTRIIKTDFRVGDKVDMAYLQIIL
jgi:large subunit ribosomal protein L17